MATNPITGKKYQLSKVKKSRVSKPIIPKKPAINLPQSKRYCLGCKKNTTFKLNPIIGHSRCTICDGSFAKRVAPCKDRKVWRLTKKAGVVEEKDIVTPEVLIERNVKWLKFVKIPVMIEAYRPRKVLHIQTLEGVMKANAGDWIIKGIANEIYPCKHNIFEKTYQRVKTEGVKG
jgi:hypothetical protein